MADPDDRERLEAELVRLQAALEAERAHAEQWRQVAEERRVALERLRQHPTVRLVVRLAAVVLPPARRVQRRSARALRRARGFAGAVQGVRHRAGAGRRERALRAQVDRLPPAPPSSRRVSVIIPTRDGKEHLARLLPALRARTQHEQLQVVVVDNGSGPGTAEFLAAQTDLRIIRRESNLSFSAANNLAAAAADGDVLCFLNDDVEPLSPGWLPRMLAALEGDVVAVGAQLVYPRRPLLAARTRDLGVQHLGIDLRPVPGGVPAAVNLGQGEDADPFAARREVAAATAACLAVDRAAFAAAGGFDERYVYGAEDVDLCWRLRRRGGRVVVAPDAVLFHYEGVTRHREQPDALNARQQRNWLRLAQRFGPELARAVALDRLTGRHVLSTPRYQAAITVTRDLESAGYGDWYTAHELGAALQDLGWDVRYVERYRDAWYQQHDDLDLLVVLLDTCDLRRVARPGLTTVAWVRNWTERWLSHPWFDDFDMVLASSRTSARLIRDGSRHDPVLFPLATNPQRFSPGDGPRRDVVFTGNFWGQDRGMGELAGAVPQLAVYGKGWDRHPDVAPLWRGSVAYAELPGIYRSAAVVVDQTAAPTLPYGALNARVFDALAAGALVLTDNQVGARELFGDALPTYETPAQLADAVAAQLEDPEGLARRAARLRERVVGEHTYAARARQLRGLLVERARRPSFVLKTSAPDRRVAETWGDWHLAAALGGELRAAGHPVRLQTAAEWAERDGFAADVAVHLKGRSRAPAGQGQLAVLWNISHPAELTPEECDAADLVLVASRIFAETLRPRTRTPVGVLLQGTDERRFRPVPPQPRFRHDVAFVGNSRFVFRRVVSDALAAGLRPAIYGANWERFVDPDLIQARFVPNHQLPALYSSVAVLLNDHWDDMRRHGIVSNRVFDALACGAAVVSDELEELRSLFGDAVACYSTPDDLRRTVERLLADPDERRRMGHAGRAAVVAQHTFARRARELLAAVAPLLDAREVS